MCYEEKWSLTVLSLPWTVDCVCHNLQQLPLREPRPKSNSKAATPEQPLHIGWQQGACGRTSLTLLEDDSTMQRKERLLHCKSSVLGKHQCVRSTESTAAPTLSFCCNPTSASQMQLLSHLFHDGTKICFVLSRFSESHLRSANRM